ncbi:MAG: prolyl oligopeptidase family serine peptidase, partial [Coleofasciculus sp. S288]|nr:prolyl oligopeptidase family serine peptidase [Coleofasciculus sp. S288]
PKTNAPARHYTYRRLTIRPIGSSVAHSLDLPSNSRIGFPQWSTDGQRLAFTLTQESGLELWVADLPSGKARRLTGPVLNATYGNPCKWLPKDEGLLCKVVPEDRGSPPEPSAIPMGPIAHENLGRKAPAITYTNLLQNPHDEALFEYYLTSELEHVSLEGKRTRLVAPALIDDAISSPNGEYILLTTLHRPFSYQVPVSRFPQKIEVLDRTDQVVHQVADLPLADDIPIKFGSVRKGPRRVYWRADVGATLYWVEALDEGDAGRPAEKRDALFQLEAPFTNQPTQLWRSEYRFQQIVWGRDNIALAWEWWYDNRKQRIWRLDLQAPNSAPMLLKERNYQDQYSDPGIPLTSPGAYGWEVLRFTSDGSSIYFKGRGASAAGVHPFLDQMELATGQTQRLWQAKDPYYEQVVDILDDNAEQFITQRQSQQDPPNYFLYNRLSDVTSAELAVGTLRAVNSPPSVEPPALAATEDSFAAVQLTDYQDWAPQFANVHKELVQYQRADGVNLSATLYLPPGYEPNRDKPLPMIFWVYPQEFKDAMTASQVTTSENTFRRPYGASVLFLLLQGYAVLDNPTLPIIGEGDAEPNDTYVEQLLMSAKAAVDYVVSRGIADPNRLAIGGHSYGAFTTANLLAHSDLFRAGIAMSGAYNRTLTPFGFQGEQRNFWETPETYIRMSPFANAAKINEPLLLIHGAVDSNPGTYPIQSERLYEAIKGLGGTVRWVELPYEDHGYRGRESVGHVLWEVIQWCDRYVNSDQ